MDVLIDMFSKLWREFRAVSQLFSVFTLSKANHLPAPALDLMCRHKVHMNLFITLSERKQIPGFPKLLHHPFRMDGKFVPVH